MTQELQKYGGFLLDDAEALDAEMGKGGSADWMKIRVGKNVVRFLPAPVGRKPFVLVKEHQLNINNTFINFACPKQMGKKPCPVCKKIDQMKSTGNPADFERAKEWFPRKRIYSYCIDRNEPEVGPKLYAFGRKIWEQLKELREDEDFGGDFTHPESGFDVVVKRKGTTKNDTAYSCRATRQSALGNDAWLPMVGDLTRFAKILSEEEILEKLGGQAADDADDGDSGAVVDSSFEEVGDSKVPF